MTEYRTTFAVIAAVLGVVGYFPYIWDVYHGRTKPHAFTWLVWGVLSGIAFAAQVVEDAGPGKWLTLTTTCVSLIVFVWALFRGVKEFARFDWAALVAAGVSLLLWVVSGDPTLAVILIVLVDVFGTLPLVRHGYLKPHEETVSMFAIYFFAWAFSIMALDTFTISTVAYSGYNVLMNAVIVAVILYSRKRSRPPLIK